MASETSPPPTPGGKTGKTASVLHAAALAAQSCADVTLIKAGDRQAECCRRIVEAESRLDAVLQVNRTLHSALNEKKRLLAESQEASKLLRSRLDGRAVEDPSRKAYIEELQGRVQAATIPEVFARGEVRNERDREIRQLERDMAKLEGRVSNLNADNLDLSEHHREDRLKMVELQGRLRTLGKRERELAKHLDFLATRLNEAMEKAVAEGGDKQGEEQIDFRNIPGLCLNKLVGQIHKHPPAVVATSIPQSPQAAATKVGDDASCLAAPVAGGASKSAEDGP
mmetsp:Transcript_120206/g.208713  ORF Transcript_120206/g.208713 Transcript_120206/m.208713 type:complete len:283 (+) Transcript_120206:3-851(+)